MVAACVLGLREQRPLQRQQALIGAFAGRAHPKPEIRHHLVVARARGVQPPRRRADDLGQPRFDVEMNVFQLALEDEFAVGDFLLDLLQTLEDRLGVILGDDAFRAPACAHAPASRPGLRPPGACRNRWRG